MDYSGKIIRKTPVTPSQTSASGVWSLDEALQAQRTNTWPIANVPDPISRSLRFRASASAFLNRTPASAGNRQTWTWSMWVKRGSLGVAQNIFAANGTTDTTFLDIRFTSSDTIQVGVYTDIVLVTTQVFRDPSAWYHIVWTFDTTQATAANRCRLYVNGSQITSFSTDARATYFAQNTNYGINNNTAHNISRNPSDNAKFLDGYLTEVNFIDGQALTPSSFGGTNPVTGVWEPRQYTGTYGTNGFLLTFSDITNTTTLGNDTSGNGNNWTTNNFSLTAGSTYDSMLDVPTQWIGYGNGYDSTRGNYATFNPILYMGTGSTKSNGNLTFAGGGTGGPPYNYSIYSTFTQNTGKWYWEVTITTAGSQPFVGMFNTAINFTGTSLQGSAGPVLYGYDGNYYNETSGVAFGSTYTTGDVIGVAVDYDNNLIWFSKNGTWQNSGVPSTGTNGKTFGSGKTWGTGYVESGSSVSASTFNINFGQRPFTYTPPAGFLALCTTNLPNSTILQGDDYFNATTYTGTGATQTINPGFESDFAWLKRRDGAGENVLLDRLRLTGSLPNRLFSNSTAAESTAADGQNSFSSTGIVLDGSGGGGGEVNTSGRTYVAWQWKANGTGVTNTAGSITSTVSANQTSGFSIVTYTGTGANATVGHGLGVAPRMVIVKNRSAISPENTNWRVYHASTGNTGGLFLNTTAGFGANSTFWNNTTPTSSVFSIGTDIGVNNSGTTYVAYCFAEVAGFSQFGSYTGNGSDNGTFTYTGFRPKYVMIKRTDSTGTWWLFDTARSPYNVISNELYANTSQAEGTGVSRLDTLSNGFKIRIGSEAQINASGGTYIYMAFAENPFKNALAR